MNKTKFLGVLIDENLTWKDHIDAISKTMSRNIGMINKLKHFVPKRILLSLYYTLVMPYLNYGILAWENSCKTYLNKLLKLQKRAIRHIRKTSFRHSSIRLFRDLHILTLNCIRGGSMVPNIWFFGSRILTPQYFGLIIFVIA